MPKGRRILSEPLGSFEVWPQDVRDALIWLNEADPVSTQANIRKTDPKLGDLTAVRAQWERHLGITERYTVTQVIERAVGDTSSREESRQTALTFDESPGKRRSDGIPEFREALLGVAGRGGVINGRALGLWRSRVVDRVVAGRRFSKAGIIDGLQRWQLVSAKGESSVAARPGRCKSLTNAIFRKRLASPSEKVNLLAGTAPRFYRLGPIRADAR